MLNYADYTYYTGTYKGNISQSLFNLYIGKASRKIDEVVNQSITETMLTQNEIIKYVACELIDLVSSYETQGQVQSKNIDGVSLTYAVPSKTEYNTKIAEVLNQLPQELIRYI